MKIVTQPLYDELRTMWSNQPDPDVWNIEAIQYLKCLAKSAGGSSRTQATRLLYGRSAKRVVGQEDLVDTEFEELLGVLMAFMPGIVFFRAVGLWESYSGLVVRNVAIRPPRFQLAPLIDLSVQVIVRESPDGAAS